MEIRFCKQYSFDDKIFTNFEFDERPGVTHCMLHTKQYYWNSVLQRRAVSLGEILSDIGIPLEYLAHLEFSDDFDDTLFEKGSTIDFGIDYSYPNVRDFMEGRTSELILDIKEEI